MRFAGSWPNLKPNSPLLRVGYAGPVQTPSEPIRRTACPLPDKNITSVLKETRVFPPSAEFVAKRRTSVAAERDRLAEWAEHDPDGFWAEQAEVARTGSSRGRKVLDWNEPHAKWFVGGKLNASYNCLDRHLAGPRRTRPRIIWEGEPGDTRTLTYQQLHREVCKFANVLKSLGIKKGDRVTIYMPMVPEAAIAMLACARIGATHSVIFGGFSADAVADRNNDAKAKLVITADGGWRRGKVVPLKANVDAALAKSPTVEKCIVFNRCNTAVEMKAGRDVWWHDLMAERERRLPRRAARQRAPALHPLHLRHDRQAEGRAAHHRRLPARHVADAQVGLRPQGRRHLLVYRRRRLGDRAQLHRLRPACNGTHGRHVRGRAEPPEGGPLLGDHREVQGHDLLHRADGDPRRSSSGATSTRRGTTCRACGCSARSASRSTPRRGCGTTTSSAAAAARSSIRGGRPRRARS